jgi:hypothetical protein
VRIVEPCLLQLSVSYTQQHLPQAASNGYTASWIEGTYVNGEPGFANSKLVFTMSQSWPAGITYTWLVRITFVVMITHHTVSTLVLFIETCACTQIAVHVLVACRRTALRTRTGMLRWWCQHYVSLHAL